MAGVHPGRPGRAHTRDAVEHTLGLPAAPFRGCNTLLICAGMTYYGGRVLGEYRRRLELQPGPNSRRRCSIFRT